MAIEKTVSELAEILGVSRQAINNRVKALPPEDTEKNEKGVTVVTRSGLIKLEEIYKKTIFEDEPVSEDVKQRELMEILVDEKNAEIVRLYEQLKAKDSQLAKKDEQLRIKDVQIAEKDKQLDQQQQRTAVFETFLNKLKGASFFLVQKIAEPHKYQSNLKISDKEIGCKKR